MNHKLKRKELLGYGAMPTGPFREKSELIRAFTWFNVSYEIDELIPFIYEYMALNKYTSKEIAAAKRNHHFFSVPTCVVAYYRVNNVDINPQSVAYLEAKIQKAITFKKQTSAEKQIVYGKEDPKYYRLIGSIDEHLDKISRTQIKLLSQYKFVTPRTLFPELKGVYTINDLRKVVEHYNPLLNEIEQVIKKADPQLVESYRKISKEHLKCYQTFLHELIVYFNENTRITRKRKKKKQPVKPIKAASKVVFRDLDINIKGVKITPKSVVTTTNDTIIATYNAKYNRMNVYVAEDQKSLVVQNNKVLNYNETKSHSKFIRIDESKIKQMTKQQFIEWFFGLKSAEISIPKKITDQVSILKVW